MKKERYIIFCDGEIEEDFIGTEDEAQYLYSKRVEENINDLLYDTMECVKVIKMGKDNFEVY